MITLIHPSRGRPAQAIETGKKWIERSGIKENLIEYILTLDSDDPEIWNYPRQFPITNFTVFINPNRSAISAINVAATWYSEHRGQYGDYLIIISDDFDCPENWARKIDIFLTNLGSPTDWILKTNDGIQPWVVTLPIMDWKYFNRFGYVYHPFYSHAWSDTELTCVAELTGRLITDNDLIFKHNHYTVGGIKDEISLRADAHFEDGRRIFQERINRNFDLPESMINGKMTDNVYTRMKS